MLFCLPLSILPRGAFLLRSSGRVMRSSGPTFVALEMADQAAHWWIGFHESIDDCKLILCNLISNRYFIVSILSWSSRDILFECVMIAAEDH